MKTTLLITALTAIWAAPMFAATTGTDVLTAVKKKVAPDSRQVVFELKLDETPGSGAILSGVTSDSTALTAATSALAEAGITFVNKASVYPYDNHGLVSIPVASLRTRAAHAGEMATQAVMGTPVRILENRNGWMRVQTPDGYIAYVPDSSIAPLSEEEFDAWRTNDSRLVATNLWQSHAFYTPDASEPRDVVTDIVLGTIVTPDTNHSPSNGRTPVILPDGRNAWVNTAEFTPVRTWADQSFNIKKILDTAYSLEGSPYLWGGTSVKSVDCSGLVKVSYLNNGIILRRDASQQALTGKRLEASEWPSYQAGDLMFFGNKSTGRITHVAIYDHDGMYIHSSGRVKRNSVDPSAPSYLYSPLHSVRIHGSEGTEGITRAIDHPWYFKTNKPLP
ncbi:MAG: C40 family peptidase [Odoribacter sp.]|nr:C40 family peptidase [Odoribacter sp.]